MRILELCNKPSNSQAPPIYKAETPARNDDYRRFIKRFTCMVCGTTGPAGVAIAHHLVIPILIQSFNHLSGN